MRGIAAQAREKVQVVHRACKQISPLYQDYATRPIQDGFSSSSSLASCAFERLYLVVLEQSIYRVAYSGLQ